MLHKDSWAEKIRVQLQILLLIRRLLMKMYVIYVMIYSLICIVLGHLRR